MNIEISTLNQIHAAQDKLADALSDPTLTQDQVILLQQTSIALRNMERAIVNKIGQDLVNALTASSKDLSTLADKITVEANKISHVAGTIKRISEIAEGLINIINSASDLEL